MSRVKACSGHNIEHLAASSSMASIGYRIDGKAKFALYELNFSFNVQSYNMSILNWKSHHFHSSFVPLQESSIHLLPAVPGSGVQ